jgi:elongator complex protein 3
VVRDIPSPDIVAGNRKTNFREVAEGDLARRRVRSRDIRAREVRNGPFDPAALALHETAYETSAGRDLFLELVTPDDRIVAFLRLLLPEGPAPIEELRESALIRELHVYGDLARLGDPAHGRPQHSGFGRKLVACARSRAASAGFSKLAVISAVGTRAYYRRLGFHDGPLYQHLSL